MLFKKFANIDAFPICLATQDTEQIIQTVKNIAPVFGGINLEDISAPRCFEIEERLQDLGIPVFHDDQHGTAIVTLAALINASKVVGKELNDMKIVVNGAGSAGIAITKLLHGYGQKAPKVHVKNIIVREYHVPESKVEVIHNSHVISGLNNQIAGPNTYRYIEMMRSVGYGIVMFFGRFTI